MPNDGYRIETGVERWEEFFQTSVWRDMLGLTNEAIVEIDEEMDDPTLQDINLINHLRGQKTALKHFVELEGRIEKLVEESRHGEE
ncbi:MAG: hypothetical protein ACXABY_08145 [Candidatus Thorarchaeota archaeon]|jgi:hypothetical protein